MLRKTTWNNFKTLFDALKVELGLLYDDLLLLFLFSKKLSSF